MKAQRLLVIASLAFAIAGPANVFASPSSNSSEGRIRVSFADLDIKHVAGAKVLYQRLRRAAASACDLDSTQTLRSVKHLAETKKCYRETLDEVVARIDSAALQKIHAS